MKRIFTRVPINLAYDCIWSVRSAWNGSMSKLIGTVENTTPPAQETAVAWNKHTLPVLGDTHPLADINHNAPAQCDDIIYIFLNELLLVCACLCVVK